MWLCKNCAEENEDNFEICWNCRYDRAGSPPIESKDTDEESNEEEGYDFASGIGGAVDSKLVGIGGWLILPAIGLLVGPIISVIGIVKLFDLFSSMKGDGYGGYFILSICIEIGLLIYTLVAAKRFWGLKRSAPATMIGLRVAGLMTSALLFIVALGLNSDKFVGKEIMVLIRDVISAAVWIPYFKVSKRVKATFVNNEKMLQEEIQCPDCGIDLKLSELERTERKFTCFNCNETFSVKDDDDEIESPSEENKA